MILSRLVYYIKKKFIPLDILARDCGVEIGNNNFISSPFWGTEPYLIKRGSKCQLTEGVRIFTHGGAQVLRDQDPEFDTFGKVVIGDWVYIGNNALIMPGVTIGDHVLVAAGSVVTKSVPQGVVIGGNPAKIICSLDEYRAKNLPYNVRTKSLDAKEKRNKLSTVKDTMFISKPMMTSNGKEI